MTIRTILEIGAPMATPGEAATSDCAVGKIERVQNLPTASGSAFPSAIAALEGASVSVGVDPGSPRGDGQSFALVRDGRVDLVLRPLSVQVDQGGRLILEIDARDLGDVE